MRSRPRRSGSAEFANPKGVDVLLKGNRLATVNGPYVNHLHRGWRSGTLVLPRVVPEHHDGVTVGDELVGYRCKLIADLPDPHEHAFKHCLRADVRASEWK